jgi:hypothetical protein
LAHPSYVGTNSNAGQVSRGIGGVLKDTTREWVLCGIGLVLPTFVTLSARMHVL